MKIQLFIPPQGYVAQRWAEGNSMPSLGILFLAAVLEQKGIDVDVVPADILKYGPQDIAARIESFSPDILGVTTTTENRFDSFNLVKIAKEVNPNIVTILGGPHISMAKEDTIAHIKEVDILSIGEGEKTILNLAAAVEKGFPLSNVRGLYYREAAGKAVFTGNQEIVDSIDELPFPARHLIPMEKYRFIVETRDGRKRKAQNIITSRGCPFNCYFCSTPVNWGRKMRGH
ncbi:MAG: cobalamin-dependent protein, partial [Thermodesulfobacteriota bacterium]